MCAFSLADILKFSVSNNESAAVADIDIDQKPMRVIFHRTTR